MLANQKRFCKTETILQIGSVELHEKMLLSRRGCGVRIKRAIIARACGLHMFLQSFRSSFSARKSTVSSGAWPSRPASNTNPITSLLANSNRVPKHNSANASRQIHWPSWNSRHLEPVPACYCFLHDLQRLQIARQPCNVRPIVSWTLPLIV